ncbi:MAG: DMT family transporter [Octadecabacter sp.]|nr:DMT family transporter [Octadecabacter sp.]
MSDIYRAALWMTGSIISFTSMAVAGRAVSVELDTFEIMLFRSVTGIVVVLIIATITGTLRQINSNQFSLHFKRNLSHFIGQNLWFFALPLISLTQLFALEFTSPIWVIFLAPFLLGERLSYINVLAATLGFLGVMIVTRPFQAEISIGTIAAACAAVTFAFTAIFTRKLTRTQSITCIMFWLTVMQATFGVIGAGYDGDITLPSVTALPLVILIGFAGLLAHFCLTKALSLAPANIVMPIDFIRLPVIAIVAAQIYDEQLDPWVFVGAVIIFGANYINIWFGHQPRRQTNILK